MPQGNYNSFKESTDIGKIGEDAFLTMIANMSGYSFLDVTKNPKYFQDDIDFIVTNKATEVETTIDVKTDTQIGKYGNICVETISNKNEERCKNGWFNTSKADFWFFYDTENEIFYAIKADELRKSYKENSFIHRETFQLENGVSPKYAEVCLIPLAEVTKLPNYRKIKGIKV